MTDERDPIQVVYPLREQLRILAPQRVKGWNDLHDAAKLRPDRLWQAVRYDACGLSPLEQSQPSQATLSRMVDALAGDRRGSGATDRLGAGR